MTTYQINYTNANDEPVTEFLTSDEDLKDIKTRFILEKADELEMIDSCVDLGKVLSEEEIEIRITEFESVHNMKDWFRLYFNDRRQ